MRAILAFGVQHQVDIDQDVSVAVPPEDCITILAAAMVTPLWDPLPFVGRNLLQTCT